MSGSADSEGLHPSTRPAGVQFQVGKQVIIIIFSWEREKMLFLTGRIKGSLAPTIKVVPLLPGDRRAGSAGMGAGSARMGAGSVWTRGRVSWDRGPGSLGTAEPYSPPTLLRSLPTALAG